MNALITGATKGIGRAIALELAKNGYNIIMCARGEEDLAELATELRKYKVTVFAKKVDCSVKQEIKFFLKELKTRGEKIQVLVNNVGQFIPGSLLDEDDEIFEKQQRVNVNSTYYFSKEVGKLMREAGSGHIFNVCSVASKAVVPNAGSYSVTKAAMLSLNHVLRMELAPHNVKVTAIIPGSTLTSSWEGTNIATEKFVQPEDIAKSILHILNLSSGVNVDELVLTPLKF